MWKGMTKLFGGSANPEKTATRRITPVKAGTDGEFERASRTVGLTEQRLRAANKQAWITSSKGWSDVLGRFSSKSK